MPLDESTLISSSGANAGVYAYGDGRALKLFRARDPRHAYELVAARAAAAAGLPTPAVWGDGLVEVDGREGIVFDRIDGVTMHQHVSEHPDQAEAAGRAMAEIQARIHACEPPDLTDLRAVLGQHRHGRCPRHAPEGRRHGRALLVAVRSSAVSQRHPSAEPAPRRRGLGGSSHEAQSGSDVLRDHPALALLDEEAGPRL